MARTTVAVLLLAVLGIASSASPASAGTFAAAKRAVREVTGPKLVPGRLGPRARAYDRAGDVRFDDAGSRYRIYFGPVRRYISFERITRADFRTVVGSGLSPELRARGAAVYWVEGTGAGCYYWRERRGTWAACTGRKTGRAKDKPELRLMVRTARRP